MESKDISYGYDALRKNTARSSSACCTDQVGESQLRTAADPAAADH
jgi:hypothetical protein